MQKIEQKQLQKLREEQKKKEQAQNSALRRIMQDDSIAIVLKYCKQILSQSFSENLSDYSPTYLSKFIFEEQLQKAKKEFEKLPNGECKIQHFLSLMIRSIDFPFEKWPFYLIGLKDMFNEIKMEKKQTITYPMFFKYVIGEVLDFKEEQQNTQFQVRFLELKKQDYLLHDTGIKKFYYSNDLKLYITLDENANILKLYNKEMKMVHKFTPNKEKHGKKFPSILWFDFSELLNKMGILLSDSTLSIINFQSFLTKTEAEFQAVNSNQIVIRFEDKMVKIFYIQMLNRWVLISEYNKFYLFDLEKYRQQQQYLVEIKMENTDLPITEVLQLVNLSVICVVTGNELYFYNENFTEKVLTEFIHGSNIKTLRYNQDTNTFYISGEEKFITLLSANRSGTNFNLSQFETQSKVNICTFQIFPTLGTLVVVDENNEVRLYDQAQKTCYQLQNYSHIVKNEQNRIKMLKTSKNQFALYETYTLIFQQEKIAIEKDVEYEFLPQTYYDKIKQEFYFSVNNQIISFSVSHGEIRKSYNQNTANVPKHDVFHKGKNTNLYIIDSEKNIYETYLKDAVADGENKNYKKKLGISSVVRSFLDEEINFTFVVGDKAIYSIRNDGNNTFAVNSLLNLQYFPPIINAKYNSIKKQIHLLSNNHQHYILNAQNYKLRKSYRYIFPKDMKEHQDKLILDYDYNEELDMDILLTNQNQIYIISCKQHQKQLYFKIQDCVPYKLRTLKYSSIKYCPKQSQKEKDYLLLWDTTGYLTEFDLTKLLVFADFKKQEDIALFKYPVKESHNLKYENVELININLNNSKCDKLDKKKTLIFRAHEKEIKITNKINIEGIHTITFSIDGNIKLWKEDKCLFNLKLPDLKKHIWEMSEIQKIKNDRSVGEIMKILNKIQGLIAEGSTPQKLMKKGDKKKDSNAKKDLKLVNPEEPIPLQIENKDIEDIVNKTQNINWYSFSGDAKRKQPQQMSKTMKVNPHPWRTKTNFMKIFDKASPVNKYKKKMPHDLIHLRVSLDMKDRRQFQKQEKQQLFILPQLGNYKPEKKPKIKKQTDNDQQEEEQVVESCIYVKKGKYQRKINELDEIDKEFKKKWMDLSEKKWVPTRKDRKGKSESKGKIKLKMKAQILNAPMKQAKYDPIKQVQGIFQMHNRQTMAAKKGRLIRIPEIKLKRDQLFS